MNEFKRYQKEKDGNVFFLSRYFAARLKGVRG